MSASTNKVSPEPRPVRGNHFTGRAAMPCNACKLAKRPGNSDSCVTGAGAVLATRPRTALPTRCHKKVPHPPPPAMGACAGTKPRLYQSRDLDKARRLLPAVAVISPKLAKQQSTTSPADHFLVLASGRCSSPSRPGRANSSASKTTTSTRYRPVPPPPPPAPQLSAPRYGKQSAPPSVIPAACVHKHVQLSESD